MARNKRFKYYLKTPSGAYYYVNADLVSQSVTPIELNFDPLEWANTELQWTRDTKYHGVFRSFVVPLSFVKDGATILRNIYYSQGVEGKCTLEVWEKGKNDIYGKETAEYELYYTGDVDFSQTSDTLTHFQVALLDSGLSAKLKASDTIPQEISIFDSDCSKVLMDGFNLVNNYNFVIPPTFVTTPANTSLAFPTSLSTTEADYINGNTKIVSAIGMVHSTGGFFASGSTEWNNFIYEAVGAQNIVLTINDQINTAAKTVTAYFSVNVILFSKASNGVTLVKPLYVTPFTFPPGGALVSLNIMGNVAFTLADGDRLYLTCGASNATGNIASGTFDVAWVGIQTQQVVITTTFKNLPSSVKGYFQRDVFRKLIASIGGVGYTSSSNYLNTPTLVDVDNTPYYTMMTASDAMRGLGDGSGSVGTVPAKIKTTLEDFMKDAYAREMAGVGVNGTNAFLEKMSFFYDKNTEILRIGEVNKLDMKISPAIDLMWNSISVGYPSNSADKLNGKDDPLLSETFASIGIRVKGLKDLTSPYIAAITTHEYIRANLSNKQTTDDTTDNDTLLIECSSTINGSGQYLLSRKQIRTAGTVAGMTGYNYGLTPKRNLLRNGAEIHAQLHLLDSTSLTFQTAKQTAEFQSKLSTLVGNVIEKANIPISSLPSPLYLPIYIEFKTSVTDSISDVMAANPYGYITLQVRDGNNVLQDVSFFVMQVSVNSADKSVQTWKGLLTPQTDLSLLIH